PDRERRCLPAPGVSIPDRPDPPADREPAAAAAARAKPTEPAPGRVAATGRWRNPCSWRLGLSELAAHEDKSRSIAFAGAGSAASWALVFGRKPNITQQIEQGLVRGTLPGVVNHASHDQKRCN